MCRVTVSNLTLAAYSILMSETYLFSSEKGNAHNLIHTLCYKTLDFYAILQKAKRNLNKIRKILICSCNLDIKQSDTVFVTPLCTVEPRYLELSYFKFPTISKTRFFSFNALFIPLY